MHRHIRLLLVALAFGCGAAGTFFSVAPVSGQTPAQEQAAPNSIDDTKQYISGPYKDLDVGSGVYNNGQAALWDLNILDHYHYFGPKERAKGYKPEQPIAFSHITHVQRNKMECQYCHWSVAKAAYAAIPEVQACMACHGLPPNGLGVQGRSDFQKGEIAKIQKYWNDQQNIPWVKVHVNPAFVNFNHKRHVKAGVSCQECHGQIPNMTQVQRVSSMKMGWWVDCHRQRGTSIDCWTCHK